MTNQLTVKEILENLGSDAWVPSDKRQEYLRIYDEVKDTARRSLKVLVRELVMESVGEDEPTPLLETATHMTQALEVKWRNQLRAEQRQRAEAKLKELFEDE